MNRPRILPLLTVLSATLFLTACDALSALAPTVESPTESPNPTHTPTLQPIIDTGPVEGAMGPVETDADGVLRYTAVEGDVGGLVCERFGRAYWQLDSNLTSGGFSCNSVIYLGEILTPTSNAKP